LSLKRSAIKYIIFIAIVLIGWASVEKLSKPAGDEQVPPKIYALEFKRPLTADERAELSAKAEWLGNINNHAIALRAEESAYQQIKELPYAKNVNEYKPAQKMAAELQTQSLPDQKQQFIIVTITLSSEKDKPYLVNLIKGMQGQVIGDPAESGRYINAKIPAATLGQLTASPSVFYVEKYLEPQFLNDRARDIVGARPLAIAGFLQATGLHGKGQIVALADSGLDIGSMGNLHPDLSSASGTSPRVIMLESWAGVETPADTIGHGTHMAGTMVGSGKASEGKYAGFAPEASLYFQGIVNNEQKLAPPADLKQLYKPAYDAGARIHVNGWGRKKNTYGSASVQIDEFIRHQPSFLAIFGAGNDGPQPGTLTIEANSKNALVVGASNSTRPAFDNAINDTQTAADFSSRGPAGDGRIKPELLAPGTSICSTASRLVEGNLSGWPDYTIMNGTSMASAVAGGSAALLRQYLAQYAAIKQPSAALMKATLINGATKLDGSPTDVGFGRLDMGNTLLSLDNDLFRLVDNLGGIATSEKKSYTVDISSDNMPFIATLAWTDPAAIAAARSSTLVNDLDLEIVGPDGKKYLGNDFNGTKKKDAVNNVEQIYIANPQTGVYEVIVQGASVAQPAVVGNSALKQDFALVYGQTPARDMVSTAEDSKFTLQGGSQVDKSEDITVAVDDGLLSKGKTPPSGADIYLLDLPEKSKIYAVGRTWRVSGINTLLINNQKVLERINKDYRDGGYAFNNRNPVALSLNGHPAANGYNITLGAGVATYLNPTLQNLWQVDVAAKEVTGILAEFDPGKKQFKLLDDKNSYATKSDLTITASDVLVDADPAERPFGAAEPISMQNLSPGTRVTLTLGTDNQVHHLSFDRYLALGRIMEIDLKKNVVTLSTGQSYSILSGAGITRNSHPFGLTEAKVGDLAVITIVPDTTRAINLALHAEVSYGRVIYAEGENLHFMDSSKSFMSYKILPEAQVFRWGLASDDALISPGQWVRLCYDPLSRVVYRVDIGESAAAEQATLSSYDAGKNKVNTSAGNTYSISSFTQVLKNDLPVNASDLVQGENLEVSSLYGTTGEKIAVELKAETKTGAKTPAVTIRSTIPFEEFSMVTGSTSTPVLYVLKPGKDLEPIKVGAGGEFYLPVDAVETQNIQLIAVDRTGGGVTGLKLKLPRSKQDFFDISGHWAEKDIRYLVSRGILAGYANGSFKPNKAVTRVEAVAMLTRLMGAGSNDLPEKPPFGDTQDIPRWAWSAVTIAQAKGLIQGYENNLFKPNLAVTRQEAAALLVRAYGIITGFDEKAADQYQYADQAKIASWALVEVSTAWQLGLLTGRNNEQFAPAEHLTRAEMSAALNRLLTIITDQKQ